MKWAILITDEKGSLLASYSSLEEVSEEAIKALTAGTGELILTQGSIKLGDLTIFGRKKGAYRVFLVFKGKFPGMRLISNALFEAITEAQTHDEIKNLAVEFMKIRVPNVQDLLEDIDKLLDKALSLDMVKYSLELRGYGYYEQYQIPLRPFKVINFEDGFKRAIIAAFNGDFVSAYNLILGSLKFKQDNLAKLMAVYLGYLLLMHPYKYPAPEKNDLKEMLDSVLPVNEAEELLKKFEQRLLEGLESYASAQEAGHLLRKNVDKLFDLLSDASQSQFLRDLLAFILITYESSVLSSQKISFLIDYIGNRSFMLNEYLKAAINKLRTWAIMMAIDIPWKDIVGNIRRLRSQFINSKIDLLDIIRQYELDVNIKKVRDGLIGTFMNMVEYLRLIYWSMGLSKAAPDDLKEFLPEALIESYEIFKMVIDALPPVNVEAIVDAAYLFSWVAYLYRGIDDTGSSDILREAFSVCQSIFEMVYTNMDYNRLNASVLIKAISLAWVSMNIASLIEDIPPFTLKALKAIIPRMTSVLKDLRERNVERYLLLDFFMRMIKANILVLIGADDESMFEVALELIEKFYSFIKAGAFIPVLSVPLVDIVVILSQKIGNDSLRERLNKKLRDVVDAILEEEISPIVKNILLKLRV